MPGILYHLSFAELVFQKLSNKLPINKVDFMSGNLIPDLAKDKKSAHYSIQASHEGFFVPNMEIVNKELLVPENSIKFGMFCHLYLDYHFIESFLIPEFIWDKENNKVINPRNNKEWTRDEFFSNSGMYGSYTEINTLMIKNGHIPLDTISKIPDSLPNSGIAIFDSRREKTWRDELNEYLSEKKEYTEDIFNYQRLWNFIKKISLNFKDSLL